MKYRKIGSTGLEVSEIGFGAWGIGGTNGDSISYGETDDKVSLEALSCALDYGINFFDTSSLYGFGHSEKLIGQAFKNKRDKVLIATKAGWDSKDHSQDFSAKSLTNSLHRSLDNLGTDYVDLFQLHSPSISELEGNQDILTALDSFVSSGKARSIGITVNSPNDAVEAIEKFGFKSVMVNFNMMDLRAIHCGLFELAKRKNVGIIAKTPLCFGFLTGLYDEKTEYDENDHRSKWSKEQLISWASGIEYFKEVTLSEREKSTPVQLALRFCLSYSELSCAIPGMLNSEQVVENARSSEQGALNANIINEIVKLEEKKDFFVRSNKHWVNKE